MTGSKEELEDMEMFSEIDQDDSQLLLAEHQVLVATGGAQVKPTEVQRMDQHEVPKKSAGSNHIFQEMAVVRKRLGFDEQDFRERCHRSSMEISQQFKGTPVA